MMTLRAAALCALPLLFVSTIGSVRADDDYDRAVRCSKYYLDNKDQVAQCGTDWTVASGNCPDACKKFWEGVANECLIDQESRDQFNEWYSITCKKGGFPTGGSAGGAPPAEETNNGGSTSAASTAAAGAAVALLATAAAALLA